MKKILRTIPYTLYLMPWIALAEAPKSFRAFADLIINLVNSIVPVLVGLALIAFLYGVAQSMLNTGNPEGRATSRKVMVYGLISLFVVVFLWGIIKLAQNTFF